MAGNHKSLLDSDFASNTKCQCPVQFSAEKPDPGEVKELYNDTNDAVNQLTLKICRGIKHDKKKKIKRKKNIKTEKQFRQYDEVLRDNMIKEFAESKSPHVVISYKASNDIKFNVIMLTRPRIENVSKNRKIFYDIK